VWCEKHFIQPCIKHTNLVLYCLKLLCVFLNRPFLSQGQILKRFPIIICPKLFFYNSSKFMLGIQSLLQLVHLKPFRNIFLHMQWCNYCPHVLRYIKDDKVIYALIYLDLSVCANLGNDNLGNVVRWSCTSSCGLWWSVTPQLNLGGALLWWFSGRPPGGWFPWFPVVAHLSAGNCATRSLVTTSCCISVNWSLTDWVRACMVSCIYADICWCASSCASTLAKMRSTLCWIFSHHSSHVKAWIFSHHSSQVFIAAAICSSTNNICCDLGAMVITPRIPLTEEGIAGGRTPWYNRLVHPQPTNLCWFYSRIKGIRIWCHYYPRIPSLWYHLWCPLAVGSELDNVRNTGEGDHHSSVPKMEKRE
jgi:hypothetical protein